MIRIPPAFRAISFRATTAAHRAPALLLALAVITACGTTADATAEAETTAASAAAGAALDTGSGSFVFASTPGTQDRPVTVWYHHPAGLPDTAPVVIVMHGASRNGEDYRDQWAGLADEHRFLLAVPEFSGEHYPGADLYNLGNMFAEDGTPNDEALWSYSAIEPIFDTVKARSGNQSERYIIYGHSAGGQFVHRFMMFKPDSRVEIAIPANAGWYTMPNSEYQFPYGMAGLENFQGRSADDWVRGALERRMIVLLGDADTMTTQSNLRRTPEAMAQGTMRFARGHSYFAVARAEAGRLGMPFIWRIDTVPGVAHSNRQMAPGAVEALGW